ncbi:Cysteine-rich CWC [Colwellia chukchiensis]|uniref:Cysteine-rich CWC n=1 Tax=Colwellia chukchiensis TaxID=641665 RepID=A0A1H7TNU1_9GAMM|nr:cysteine-rich CWC family protein [Colwellia chukchiensis]SEL86431.1 Cysteine-rich CWC [Colwellia chukchiensis]
MSSQESQLCPLCQQANHCAVNANTPCWCVNHEVKPALLAQVPSAMANKVCICQQCIEKFNFDNAVNKGREC